MKSFTNKGFPCRVAGVVVSRESLGFRTAAFNAAQIAAILKVTPSTRAAVNPEVPGRASF
jgi:hypothetical protein